MKIILIALNSRYTHSGLALRCLQKYCKDFDISVAEFTINDNPHSVYARLLETGADVYAFSCYIWNITRTAQVAEMLKTAVPGCTIVFGGPQCGDGYDFVDHYIDGEGEQPLHSLLTGLDKQEVMSRRLCAGAPLDLTGAAQPYTEADILALRGKIIYFETSRGCPFSCSYCLSSVQGSVRYFPIAYVKEGLSLLMRHHVPIVKLVDRTFNCDNTRAAEIIRFITENSQDTCVHLEIAPHLLTDELIALMGMSPQFFKLEMGIQSANPDTAASINRKFDLNTAAENIRKARAAGLEIHLDLIAGLPFEDYASFARSFDFAYALRPHMLQLGFLKVLHGTPIEADDRIRHMHSPPFEVLSTDWLTAQELCRLKEVEDAVDRLYNSGAFARSIEILTCQSPFAVFERLADSIKAAEQNGSLPRHQLYEVLHDFGGQTIAEALVLDFLQYNKDRPLPDFAKRTPSKDFKRFCQDYMRAHGLSHKDVRFECVFGKVILANYSTDKMMYL